ncbi:septum formation family protein [Gammaproteobacteria bacterium]|nr:septum formation family protein [Gammaproteobacteria bacterium]
MKDLLLKIILFLLALFIFFWLYQDAERDDRGEIMSAGNVDALSLRVGDCFNDVATKDLVEGEYIEVSSVEGVPCSTLHQSEVFSKSSSLFNDKNSFPDEETLSNNSYDYCSEQLPLFLGLDFFSEQVDTQIEEFNNKITLRFYFPTEEGWRTGDRTVDCIITSKGEGLLISYKDFYKN